MLSVILRRSSFAAQKAWHWASPPQRCWTSALTGASAGGSSSSLQTCWASTAERDNRRVKPPLFPGFKWNQTQASSFLVRNQPFHTSATRLKKRVKPPPPPRELGLLRYDMEHLWEGPKPALLLGFSMMIPFAAPALYMAVTEIFFSDLAYVQVAYSAAIISFLGGSRWGFALPESSPGKPDLINLASSVVPPLLAWGTMLMSNSIIPSATMAIMGLGIALHYDLALLPTYPSWLKALFAILAAVGASSLLGTLVVKQLYPEKKLFSD